MTILATARPSGSENSRGEILACAACSGSADAVLPPPCMEGLLASASPYIAMMDADLQHDERLLPLMLEALDSGAVDLVVGSRYVAGGGVGDWSSGRVRISGFATRLSRFICKADIADPLSGFFKGWYAAQ
jgi:dolichol-phosphate mannosyltransferase